MRRNIADSVTTRDLTLPLVFKRAASPKSMQSMAWLFNYHIDWDEPLQAAA